MNIYDFVVKEFCSLNYGVTFPIFKKIYINGNKAEPLFNYLKDSSPGFLGKSIKWNFTKFLIDSKGNVIDRFPPTTEAKKLESRIEKLIKSN